MNKYEKLEILREETSLDLLSVFRIHRECKRAEHLRDLMAMNDHTHFYSVDYSSANELELNIRYNKLKSELVSVWKQYIRVERDGIVLDEFVDGYLERCKFNRDKKMENGRTLKM